MGSEVKAICKCGYHKKILIGGGMMNFTTTEYFPCFCEDCNDMVEGNLKAEKLTCPNCNSQKVSPYNNKTNIGKAGKNIVSRSFLNVLHDGTYKCPQCKNMSLQFHHGGLHWD